MKLPKGEFPSEFGVDKNGIKDWKGPEILNMMASFKALPTFVLFYHPKCKWCMKAGKEWVELGKKFNVDGTGVRIEAVNGSFFNERKDELGVKTWPDFRFFNQGDDNMGVHFKGREK